MQSKVDKEMKNQKVHKFSELGIGRFPKISQRKIEELRDKEIVLQPLECEIRASAFGEEGSEYATYVILENEMRYWFNSQSAVLLSQLKELRERGIERVEATLRKNEKKGYYYLE